MHFLYPSSELNPRKVDEMFEPEFNLMTREGYYCSIINKQKPRLAVQDPEIIYRGWMLTSEEYNNLQSFIESQESRLLTSLTKYLLCHYLPRWYSFCSDLTPKTIIDPKDLTCLPAWKGYFIKDYVKSLTTNRGSVAQSPEEIPEIIGLIEQLRGQIEGGICIREFEDFIPDTEERYFVFKKKPFSRNGQIPPIVLEIISRINSPFFSVDLVLNDKNEWRLIELGDGQVSDIKKWTLEQFVKIFH